MKLRTQILVFLFLFAFAPLFIAFLINLPLVLDRFEFFYHEAHTQNLRADFRDLDQHLASRYELVSLLSKLPEPGSLLPGPFIELQETAQPLEQTPDENSYQSLPLRQYVSWINRIMAEQRDVVLLSFADKAGNIKHAFMRDRQTASWQHIEKLPVKIDIPRPGTAPLPARSGVLISPIIIRKEFLQQDPRLFMTLNLSSAIYHADNSESTGFIIITVDVTDFARYYQNTIWVQSDGQYLFGPREHSGQRSAFDDYQGLRELFAKDQLVLWQGNNNQRVIWVPMLRTASGEPLWVGRHVDPSPISEIKFAISWRVTAILLVLVIFIFYLARKFAHRVERFDQELTDGITKILEEDKAIDPQWKGPVEIQELSEKLAQLSQVHANNTQRALHHARELEASNRYKSEFLANVSHELRTPLNSILLLSKLIMQDSHCSQDQMDKARVINTAGKDLKSLIDNILDLSRIEAGKISFSVHQTDLKELLEELVILMRPQFEAKNLSLKLITRQHLPESLFTDSEKVRQIIKNFLSNALKFTDSGEVEIIVEAHDDDTIMLSVKDHGIGIPDEKQSHIFGSFQQADGSISRRHGGTGLGLAISNQLAQLMGGHISLQSSPGEGACFTLHLPIHFDTEHIDDELVDLQLQENVAEPDIIRSEPADIRPKHQHILVVDDDIQTLLSLTPVLEAAGYTVSGAGDSDEAIETLEADPDIDLVLLDLEMPGKDGYATIAEIEKNPAFADLPVITMSCESQTEGQHHKNIRASVSKPIDTDALKTLFVKTFT
jgi:signal transduction histidine kinase